MTTIYLRTSGREEEEDEEDSTMPRMTTETKIEFIEEDPEMEAEEDEIEMYRH